MSNYIKNPKKIRVVKTQQAQIVGEKEFIDPTTGEVSKFTVIHKEIQSDNHFHKIWLQDILMALDLVGGKKVKVFNYLLGKMSAADNTVYGTYRSISKASGISYKTVADTIKMLINANVLSKIQTGVYRFNPALIIQGKANKRQKLLITYNTEKMEEIKAGISEEED